MSAPPSVTNHHHISLQTYSWFYEDLNPISTLASHVHHFSFFFFFLMGSIHLNPSSLLWLMQFFFIISLWCCCCWHSHCPCRNGEDGKKSGVENPHLYARLLLKSQQLHLP
ncbi:unnamed protein product [Lactuca virosa]|uniref:Uncharacterized protein n=1 Tax=Lactuca virosa TaxID=75947 RepID=A0AAU9M7V8_9ASTR|nr:unnamed protein product [Lactuca virosa]